MHEALTPAEQTVLDLLRAHPGARLRLNSAGAEIVRLSLNKKVVNGLRERGALLLYGESITNVYVVGAPQAG